MGTLVTVAAAVFAMTVSVTPSSGGPLSPPQITINNQAGQQFDPHVDGDTAAYSNFVAGPSLQEIRYYDFPTNQDLAISTASPGGAANDLLSDVDQGRIVFTRLFPDGHSGIMLFEVATQAITELAASPTSSRMGVALGAQSVAYIDFALSTDGSGEVVLFNLATNTVTRLTNDAVSDANPAVSPDGNVVTWERCVSAANCDIYRAVRSGSIWVVNQVSSTIFTERSADTNGTQVVFQRENSAGPTGSDIVVAPVAGGPETVLQIPGEQFNPSIRGQLVAFESRILPGKPDIFVVDLATNRIFQVTNTPDVFESLNDITVLPGGELRLVWEGDADIYAATFTLPAAPVDAGVPDAGVPDAGVADAGVPDAGSVDAGTVCLNRTVTLEATRFYSPTRSVDGDINLSPPMRFAIPAALPVIAGNAGNKKATLTIELANGTIECEYRSRSNQSHPTSPGQLALASSYVLTSCEVVNEGCGGHGDEGNNGGDDGHGDCHHGDSNNHSCGGSGSGNGHHGHGRHHHSGPSYGAGSIVRATNVHLHIQNGDTHKPMTKVRVVLAEVCTSSVSSPLEAGDFSDVDGPQAAGCSSTGASLTPFVIAFAFLALMLRRSGQASIRLVARQEQRRLPR